jgi:hypothetical protein
MNKYTVQTYLTMSKQWIDEVSFPTVVEAVNYYLNARCNLPSLEYRIIQILEVEE